MKQPIARETKQNPLARQAAFDAPTYRKITLVGFNSQSDKLLSDAVGGQSLHNIPSHRDYLPAAPVTRKTSQQQTGFTRETERTMSIDAPQSGKEVIGKETISPLASIAGSYADDPFWKEFVQAMEQSRQAMDTTTTLAE